MDDVGRQLAEWGKVAMLRTRGRRSGAPVDAAVGYVDEADGSLLVAAGRVDADWALNLANDPRCTVRIGDAEGAYTAEPLLDSERAHAIGALILRYGTPAESLGAGPAFRLRPSAS